MAGSKVYDNKYVIYLSLSSSSNNSYLVVLESTSCWFKRAINSLRSFGAVKEESSSSTPEIGPEGWITPDFAEFAVSACNYPAIKKAGEEATPSPPDRKKKALLVPSQFD